MSINYNNKYLKYKNKYLNMKGGGCECDNIFYIYTVNIIKVELYDIWNKSLINMIIPNIDPKFKTIKIIHYDNVKKNKNIKTIDNRKVISKFIRKPINYNHIVQIPNQIFKYLIIVFVKDPTVDKIDKKVVGPIDLKNIIYYFYYKSGYDEIFFKKLFRVEENGEVITYEDKIKNLERFKKLPYCSNILITYLAEQINENIYKGTKESEINKIIEVLMIIIMNSNLSFYEDNQIYERYIEYPDKPKIDKSLKKVKSVIIKNQEYFGTCWAHSYARTFIRTFQVLGVIPNEYVEQFYLLFYVIMINNPKRISDKCNTGDINDAEYLFNILKEYFDDTLKIKKIDILKIKKNKIRCLIGYYGNKNDYILNINERDKNILTDLKYLFNNNILYLFEYRYKINDSKNNPTPEIRNMLNLRLQSTVNINLSKSMKKYLKENSNYKFNLTNSNCVGDNIYKHAVNLRKWTKDGIQFKNSWGIDVRDQGNFSIQDLKLLICYYDHGKKKNSSISFDCLMFNKYKINAHPELKIKLNNNLSMIEGGIHPTISTDVEIDNNRNLIVLNSPNLIIYQEIDYEII